MHIQLAQDAPLLLRAAAGSALTAHVGGGSLGILAGIAALTARKGGRIHRWAGTAFFGAMLAMSAAAAVTAPFLPDRVSAAMGVFVFYLTLTGWLTVRRPPMETGRLDVAATLLGTTAGAGFLAVGVIASGLPNFVIDHEPGALAFVIVPFAAMAVALDLRLMRAGGIAGPGRTRRHLWRLCTALLIAEGSALGQRRISELIPHGVMPWLLAGVAATFATMIYYLVRQRGPRRRRHTPASVPVTA
jgi:hypothetical protein